MKKKAIAAELGIPLSILCTVLKNIKVLRENHAVANSKMMWLSDPTRSGVDMGLFQWFTKLELT